MEAAHQDGFQAREATALVEQAFGQLTALDPGAAALGLQPFLAGAQRVAELAGQAEADAAGLPAAPRRSAGS